MILIYFIRFRALRAARFVIGGWIGCCLAAASVTKVRARRVAWCWCYLAALALPWHRRCIDALDPPARRRAGQVHPVPFRLTENTRQEGRRAP